MRQKQEMTQVKLVSRKIHFEKILNLEKFEKFPKGNVSSKLDYNL
jgi:hypothetical protein